MSEWQPIETAPRDGKSILVHARDGDMIVAHWEEQPAFGWSDWADSRTGYRVHKRSAYVTHWMPLPDPPKMVEREDLR